MKKVLILGLLWMLCLSGCFSEGGLKPGIHGTSAGKKMEEFLEFRPDKRLSNPSLSDYQIKTSQNFYFYNFIAKDLSTLDLSSLTLSELANEAMFTASTKWPATLPNLDIEHFWEQAWGKPLGAALFHENGITGKGVGIAIIGPQLYVDHPEYKDNLKLFYGSEDPLSQNLFSTLGSSAMLSNLAGKSLGYAPEASIAYIVNSGYDEKGKQDLSSILENMDSLLEYNKTLKKDPIRMILILSDINSQDRAYDMYRTKVEELKQAGIEVMTKMPYFNGHYFTTVAKIPYAPLDDVNSYYFDKAGETPDHVLYLPYANRVLAFPGEETYFYYPGSFDVNYGTISTLAGFYALALQMDPSLTLDEFVEIVADSTITLRPDKEYRVTGLENVIYPSRLYDHLASRMKES